MTNSFETVIKYEIQQPAQEIDTTHNISSKTKVQASQNLFVSVQHISLIILHITSVQLSEAEGPPVEPALCPAEVEGGHCVCGGVLGLLLKLHELLFEFLEFIFSLRRHRVISQFNPSK